MSAETKKITMIRLVEFGKQVKLSFSVEYPKEVDEFVISNVYQELLRETRNVFETIEKEHKGE